MITLRVVLDEVLSTRQIGVARYSKQLARALVQAAPRDCQVRGLASALSDPDIARVTEGVPGLTALDRSAFARRELQTGWRLGVTHLPTGALVHAPSLFAPLRRHDRINDGTQIAVTIHDATPWTAPELLRGRDAAWLRAMGDRARRFADAIVAPSHTIADALSDALGVGDRVRVIGGAPSPDVAVPSDAGQRARTMRLPEEYIVGVGDLQPAKGMDRLLAAMTHREVADIPLVLAGVSQPDATEAAVAAGLPPERVVATGVLGDADLATVLDRATVLALPSRAESFGLTMLEAMALGTPVVYADIPTLREVAADTGHGVALDDDDSAPEALAVELSAVLADEALRREMSITGADRATAYTWRGAADQVWRLHADL